MMSIQLIILLIIIFITVGIIIWCIISKGTITESLLVSPTKLYSHKHKEADEICEINNKNQNKNSKTASESESDGDIYGYADYITISDYLRIKNENPLYRPGRELIGKKVRIMLPRFKKETIPDDILSEDTDYCGTDSSEPTINIKEEEEESKDLKKKKRCSPNNNQKSSSSQSDSNSNYDSSSLETLNKGSSCYLSEDEYGSLETETQDKKYSYSDYFKCLNNECWYDVNIINYSLTMLPCSMHKIEWKNELGVVEFKWVNLYDYQIEVPVEPHSIYFKNEIGDKISHNPYYFWKAEIEDGYSVINNKNPKNLCSKPLTKKYYGQIGCSKSQDCHKYGSLYCNNGICETKYIQI